MTIFYLIGAFVLGYFIGAKWAVWRFRMEFQRFFVRK